MVIDPAVIVCACVRVDRVLCADVSILGTRQGRSGVKREAKYSRRASNGPTVGRARLDRKVRKRRMRQGEARFRRSDLFLHASSNLFPFSLMAQWDDHVTMASYILAYRS